MADGGQWNNCNLSNIDWNNDKKGLWKYNIKMEYGAGGAKVCDSPTAVGCTWAGRTDCPTCESQDYNNLNAVLNIEFSNCA